MIRRVLISLCTVGLTAAIGPDGVLGQEASPSDLHPLLPDTVEEWTRVDHHKSLEMPVIIGIYQRDTTMFGLGVALAYGDQARTQRGTR